jgi:hypothetical protein
MPVEFASSLLKRIYEAREKANVFFNQLNIEKGYKNTSTHDPIKYPCAVLYGSWASVLGLSLIQKIGSSNSSQIKGALDLIQSYRQKDGTIWPILLANTAQAKSFEYIKLHCTNYSLGAIMEMDPNYDFESTYLDRFLDADYLQTWLDGRSFYRPWEEGNNVVNVTAYLALIRERGIPHATDRLAQLLEWHRKFQNPKTGGFDCFKSPSYKYRSEILAGAVHNFHLHLYLGEPYGSESIISTFLPRYLYGGRLTACLSIDFVELAVRTLPFAIDPNPLLRGLVYHITKLLDSQRADGGWLEADNDYAVVTDFGFQDNRVSSCSYATWFRLAALGMVAITLLGDHPGNWSFRKTLGMGYAPAKWPTVSEDLLKPLSLDDQITIARTALPQKIKTKLIKYAGKFL